MGAANGERAAPASGGRDPYLDLLRAAALVRVVTYHAFVWPWLTLIFPAMGVMFALAGSLMARSLERPALSVIGTRMRRLLVPFWLFAILVVAAMLIHGWGPDDTDAPGPWWARMLFWVVPLHDPPHSAWAWQVNAPLWYVSTYLWFVILSPVLLLAFRRWPVGLIVGFLMLIVLLENGLILVGETMGRIVTNLATFGACWLLGFAHRDGLVDRLQPRLVWTVAAGTMIVGGWFALTHQTDQTYDLGGIPIAQAYWSFGYVLVLIRFRPRMTGLARVPPLDRLVSLFNSRAVTIYLWHQVALIGSVLILTWMWSVPSLAQSLPLESDWLKYLLAWPLIILAIVLFGWAEGLAAKRRSPPGSGQGPVRHHHP